MKHLPSSLVGAIDLRVDRENGPILDDDDFLKDVISDPRTASLFVTASTRPQNQVKAEYPPCVSKSSEALALHSSVVKLAWLTMLGGSRMTKTSVLFSQGELR